MSKTHSFHIPVMGLAFTLETPLKVSHFGIDSVVSLVDDILMEKLRKVYCDLYKIPYDSIPETTEDFRAKRITSYLNLLNQIAEKKIEDLKNATIEKAHDVKEYFNMLPDSSTIKQEFKKLTHKYFNFNEIKGWIKDNLKMGKIDVNIMTKLDKENYKNGEKLPIMYNDAHAALRGFAQSNLESSLVLSAGLNPKLYSYIEEFEDFYPNDRGEIRKQIILKVSDFRSALIQGKLLANKGIWISEYRIESGLNCGGHAFATDGFLLGPILAEFRDKRKELIQASHEALVKALAAKNRYVPEQPLPMRVTAQGGVGTAEEHEFLLEHYQLDSVGWGSPFLLVPEAVTIDSETLNQLIEADESDLYLSEISPLGVHFNSLRGNTKDVEKAEAIAKGRPGFTCQKRFLVNNTEFTEKRICTASRHYQRAKIKELEGKNLAPIEFKKQYDKITEKSCLCFGLAASAFKVHNLDTTEGTGVSVCPGPNLAYFSKEMTLKEMVDHIYGRANMMLRTDRPHVFIKELSIYIEYLKTKIEEIKDAYSAKQAKYLLTFISNLKDGINYYHNLFTSLKANFQEAKANIFRELENSKKTLQHFYLEIENLKTVPCTV